jgi:DnaJ-class molecular chaperone
MKNYYKILGIPENASHSSIKSAFRKLAFEYHPDTNPGNEKQAAVRFKEINEAYAVLGDNIKRQQYDHSYRNPFSSTDNGGFQYSQQDIFRGIFANQTFINELNQMFSQAGLRFDRGFINQVFYSGRGSVFHFYTPPGKGSEANQQYSPGSLVRKQNWLERLLSRTTFRFSRFMIKKLLGIEYTPNLNMHMEIRLTAEEIAGSGEKEITYKQGKRRKKLLVKIPSTAKTGTKLRLKGMGLRENKQTGDLYLHIKIVKQNSLNPT